MCVLQAFPKTDIMLDNEMQGSGVYNPEMDEPEYCNPQSTSLWELHTLTYPYPYTRIHTHAHTHTHTGQPHSQVLSSPIVLSRCDEGCGHVGIDTEHKGRNI